MGNDQQLGRIAERLAPNIQQNLNVAENIAVCVYFVGDDARRGLGNQVVHGGGQKLDAHPAEAFVVQAVVESSAGPFMLESSS